MAVPLYDDSNAGLLLGAHPPGALPRRTRYGSPDAQACGLVPMADFPDQLVKPDQFKEVIARCHELKIFPVYHIQESKVVWPWNQNGLGYCHTADTECLTEKGWVPFPEYDWASPLATVNPVTHGLEFQLPFQKHAYEYDGPMVYSTNRRVNFGVTPDHQMYVRKWDESKRTLSDQYSFVRAADLGWYAGLLSAPRGQIGTEFVDLEVPGDRSYSGDDFLALLGLVVSDGYAGGTEKTRNWVSFASFREESHPAIAALAARLGFHECPGRAGVWVRYDAAALAAWVRQNCYAGGLTGARAKRVPDLIKCASMRQIRHFLHWFDDRNRAGDQFYSVSKRLIDDLQELHLRIGKRSTISHNVAKDVPFNGKMIHGGAAYTLTVASQDRLCLDRKKHIETDRYKGMVYCAAVPNHTLLTRRNGTVLISSNCWNYGLAGAMMAARERQGLPRRRLCPTGLGWLVGWQNQGYFLDGAIAGARERGIPTVEYAPEQNLNPASFKPGWEQDALLYRPGEIWDVNISGDVNAVISQCLTILACGIDLYIAHNWWGHALQIVGLKWDEKQPNNVVWQHWNSHDDGLIDIAGPKGVPDEAYGIRTTTLA